MTSNQNAPSTKNDDSDWLMGIFTKATSNQIPSVLKMMIFIGGILSLLFVARVHSAPIVVAHGRDSYLLVQ
jgi:hypothetical protein